MRRKGDTADDWTDFNRSDPGVTLLELLSYVADLLSYYNARSAGEQRLSSRRRYVVALAGLFILFAWWRSTDGTNDD